MAGNIGRSAKIKKAATVIAGIRDFTMSWGGASINITSGEDSGVRLLLPDSGEEQLDISGEGIMKETTFMDIALTTATSKMLTDITIDLGIIDTTTNSTPGTITGDFRLSATEIGNPYQEAITFSLTLESSGPWVYVAETV